jgi:hypothetical protein
MLNNADDFKNSRMTKNIINNWLIIFYNYFES